MSDLRSWLEGLGLGKYAEIMQAHDVDISIVADVTEQDLEKLGLSLGHRRKLLSAAAKLRDPVLPSSESTFVAPERRQLTVAFVDLVAATALGAQLDPEDLIRLLRQYRDACLASVSKYDGYVAQYLGDGVLVYFGYPQAQEDAAERGVRASLEIVENVARLRQPNGQPLRARVGIATGLVVAGGAPGVGPAGEETVVGNTPNLAARLQSVADPNSVLVAPSTHRLTRNFFEYSFFGETPIKGFSEPIAVWRVLRESTIDSRFAAAHAATGPLVGRERELAFLNDSWQRAVNGDGHVILLVGEAGIGKSRLLEAFADRIEREPSRILRCQCSPYHRNSALYPFEKLLRHRLGVNRDLSDQENVDRIERLLVRFDQNSRTARLLLAELLDVRSADALSPLELTPTQRKEETLALLERLVLAPKEGPVLLLLEDAHWSDQTSQVLIDRILKRIGKSSALAVITLRPELHTAWSDHPDATVINCKPIDVEHCEALIRQVASTQPIEETIIREIVARSDGVPLFAEELTKAIVDLRPADASAIPLTLQDTLMARLDRLGRAKDVAQIASVIGRQFSLGVLRAIAGANDNDLKSALTRLREAGLFFEVDGQNQLPDYSFNHSLVQEAAYESLSRDRRQMFHKAIAEFLASRLSDEDNEPALMAYHYGRAAQHEKSVHYWLLAADRSSQRLAFADSIASLESALTEAARVADPTLRSRLSVDAQLKLGITLANYRGPQTAEAGVALEEAKRLAEEAGAGPQMFQATWGLYLNAARTHRLDKAKVLGEQLLKISDQVGDDGLKLEALHHRWGYAFFTGQTPQMIEFTTEGLRHYDRERHHQLCYVFAGHDVAACAHCARAIGLGLSGRAKSVRSAADVGLQFTLSLQHPLTLGFYYAVACTALHIAGDLEGCREYAEELVRVASKYDYPAVGFVGSFMRGASLSLESVADAIRQMEPAFEAALSYGFLGVYPGVTMASALATAGRDQEALKLVKRLLDSASTPQTGVFVPELWRLRGELSLQQSADDKMEAERCLSIAERIAREQSALIYQLRASTSLAELLAHDGRHNEARNVLDIALSYPLDEWLGPETATAAQLRLSLS
jgi:class 3 adenylate cyclase